jgi:hypothetical protein
MVQAVEAVETPKKPPPYVQNNNKQKDNVTSLRNPKQFKMAILILTVLVIISIVLGYLVWAGR